MDEQRVAAIRARAGQASIYARTKREYAAAQLIYQDVPWLLDALAAERAAHARATHTIDGLIAQRNAAEAENKRLRKSLTTLDSIIGNTLADDEPENFRLLLAMQHIVRAALAGTPPPPGDGAGGGGR